MDEEIFLLKERLLQVRISVENIKVRLEKCDRRIKEFKEILTWNSSKIKITDTDESSLVPELKSETAFRL